MAPVQAQRTLVKSPPELSAELSDLECLARHLGEFGEIRITRLEAEQIVAWEGEHASGTVRLEASGWGTKVTLTAEVPERRKRKQKQKRSPRPSLSLIEPEPEPAPEPISLPKFRSKLTFRDRVRRWFRGPEIEMAPRRRRRTRARAREPEPEPVIEETPPAPEPASASASASEVPDAHAVLTAVLDHLGAAHHRPFSRG